jgi:type I restriction enzyme, S subunit
LVNEALLLQENCHKNAEAIKRATTRTLFTRGLSCEAQKETEIGLVPESWIVGRLDQHARVISTRMSYSELEDADEVAGSNGVKVLGIKVADMNSPGNETELKTALLEKSMPLAVAQHRCAPPRTIIFPKRGAAIATNKKRMAAEWTAFDPNVIGVVGGTDLDQDFLFQWFQTFDLRTITEPGPTPQLNKKNLDPLVLFFPSNLDEQREIVSVLNAIDHKMDLHRRKLAVLEELFESLLHKLMTGEICVEALDLSALEAAAAVKAAA